MSLTDTLGLLVLISAVVVVGFLVFGGNWVVHDLGDTEHIESVEVTNMMGSETNEVTVTLTEPNPEIVQIQILQDGKTLGITMYPIGSRAVTFEVEDISPEGEYTVQLVSRDGVIESADFRLVEEHPWL